MKSYAGTGQAPDLSPAWTDLLQLHPDGILVVSRREGVEFVNSAAERILGADRAELQRMGLGSTRWQARVPGGRKLRRRDFPVLRALRTGLAVQDAEVQIRRPDGSGCTLSVNAAPFRREDGDEVVIASRRDILKPL